MEKFKYYVKSTRLRTLPLSLAGIITGIGLAAADYRINWGVAALVALTAVCLQILSNVSNEYGDCLSGTDGDDNHPKRKQPASDSPRTARRACADTGLDS